MAKITHRYTCLSCGQTRIEVHDVPGFAGNVTGKDFCDECDLNAEPEDRERFRREVAKDCLDLTHYKTFRLVNRD